jgi:DNA-binding phage protein
MSKHNDLIIDDDEDDIEGFESYLDEMMEDDLPQMMSLINGFVDSAIKLTQLCVDAEIKSGKNVTSQHVRNIFKENFAMISSIGQPENGE